MPPSKLEPNAQARAPIGALAVSPRKTTSRTPMIISPSLTPTCLGLPLAEQRPLTPEERSAIQDWLAQRRQEDRWWICAWIIVAILPGGLLAALMAAIFLGSDHSLTKLSVVAWFFAILAACLGGLLMELLRPTRPWTRWALVAALLSGALGTAALAFGQTWGDPFLFPVFFAGLITLAVFLVRILDRTKLVRRSKVQRDLARDEAWAFKAAESAELILLPDSGLLIREGERPFPLPEPLRIQLAAPPPVHRWELPAQGLEPTEGDTRLLFRSLEPPERHELTTLAKAHFWRGLPTVLVLGGLGGIGLGWLAWRLNADGLRAISMHEWLFAGGFGVVSIWGFPDFFRLRRGLKADLAEGRVVVVRRADTGKDAPPVAEVLPHSRIMWSEGGRLGPFRLRHLKHERFKV